MKYHILIYKVLNVFQFTTKIQVKCFYCPNVDTNDLEKNELKLTSCPIN